MTFTENLRRRIQLEYVSRFGSTSDLITLLLRNSHEKPIGSHIGSLLMEEGYIALSIENFATLLAEIKDVEVRLMTDCLLCNILDRRSFKAKRKVALENVKLNRDLFLGKGYSENSQSQSQRVASGIWDRITITHVLLLLILLTQIFLAISYLHPEWRAHPRHRLVLGN